MATYMPQDDYHKMGLRLPRDVHQRLQEAAFASGRSVNNEIVTRLQNSFETGPGPEVALALARKDFELANAEAQFFAVRRDQMEFAKRVKELLQFLAERQVALPVKAAVESVLEWADGILEEGPASIAQLYSDKTDAAAEAHDQWRNLLLEAMPPQSTRRRAKTTGPSEPEPK